MDTFIIGGEKLMKIIKLKLSELEIIKLEFDSKFYSPSLKLIWTNITKIQFPKS